MSDQIFDLFVVGGGVNGCGVARDAAGRGYSVYLAEMNDLASGTSSQSTKLVHGGLRYLEHFEFRLVREALGEREHLWANAPHIIRPLRFILPHHEGLRPRWLLRLGLWLYDHIGGRKLLPKSRGINLKKSEGGVPLDARYKSAFEYSDCWVDDARLVVLNAMDAQDKGAVIATRTKVMRAERDADGWQIEVSADGGKTKQTIRARMLVNAAGPWVDEVLNVMEHTENAAHIRMVKGSHMVVKKLFDHDKCYMFQNADNRIVFAIPYERNFTLIGTTDEDYAGDPGDASISSSELNYLCEVASAYFAAPVTRADVVWAYAGVRPLYDDGASAAQEATRDYVLSLDHPDDAPALLTIFGGKLTTYRRLSEDVLGHVEKALGEKGPAWTLDAPLPGGDFAVDGFDHEVAKLRAQYGFLNTRDAKRLIGHYGTRAYQILGDAKKITDLGEFFGGGLSAREVDYLIAQEWAEDCEDILWRRSKLGLISSDRDVRALKVYLQTKLPALT